MTPMVTAGGTDSTETTDPAPHAGAAGADLPSGTEKTVFVRSMFDAIAPRYDMVNRIMTLGLDQRWRRLTVRALGLPAGSRVLDLACGTGDLLAILGGEGFRSIGLDFSSGMLAANVQRAPLAQADGSALPLAEASMDGVTCGYALRNFTDLDTVFTELGRVVRPGGRISLLEVSEPVQPLLALGDRIWFRRVVPVIGGVLSDRDAYRYLPKSTAYLPSTEELRAMLGGAGFSSVNHRPLSGGLSQLVTATRKGRPDRGGRT